ncbi:hypothetical protein HY604_01475, partial [Candidatus Peregrinibacteria bacterium]|nr:hypothetical protein [Candidatus Peregrinibacteria bacterium]
KIADKVNERIAAGILDGELWPKDFDDNQIYFDSDDLATALHGIIKIEYLAKKLKNGHMKVNLKIFDVYDFEIQINLKYLL